jgi:hypothetical protein
VAKAHEMSIFTEAINYHHNDILAFTFRQSIDEIHADINEWSMRNRQRL